MGKILFWILIILGALFVARLLATHQRQREQASRHQAAAHASRRRNGTSGTSGTKESMVRCAHCHIYLPRSDALLQQGDTWCCEAHARLGKRLPPR